MSAEFHSFTPPTGPNGGMSRDGHATVFASRFAWWAIVGLGIAGVVYLLRKK